MTNLSHIHHHNHNGEISPHKAAFAEQPRRPLQAAAGWLITAALIYAPFDYGSVSPFAIQHMELALFAAWVCWSVDCLLARRFPAVPVVVLVCGVLALGLGWFMTWNGHVLSTAVSGLFRQHRPALPGAVEVLTARLTMLRLDALYGGLLVACDLADLAVWRKRWAAAIALTGAAIATFGILQQAGLVTFVPSRMNPLEGEYFSTFNYHANAGAYMNLAMPLAYSLCVYAFVLRKAAIVRWGSLTIVLAILAGIMANTSRGAQAVSAALVVGLTVLTVMQFTSRDRRLYRRRHILWPAVVVLTLGLLSFGVLRSARNAQKWRELPSELVKNSSRWQVWRVALPMAKSGGALGHGPGSFKMLLPVSPLLTNALYSRWIIQRYIPGRPISMWSMAHDDYLQTWVEFGWIGVLLSGTIVVPGVLRGLARSRRSMRTGPDGIIPFGAAAAMIGVLVHATFDFPLQVASIQLTAVVLLGICWAGSRGAQGHGSDGNKGTAGTAARAKEDIDNV